MNRKFTLRFTGWHLLVLAGFLLLATGQFVHQKITNDRLAVDEQHIELLRQWAIQLGTAR